MSSKITRWPGRPAKLEKGGKEWGVRIVLDQGEANDPMPGDICECETRGGEIFEKVLREYRGDRTYDGEYGQLWTTRQNLRTVGVSQAGPSEASDVTPADLLMQACDQILAVARRMRMDRAAVEDAPPAAELETAAPPAAEDDEDEVPF